MKIEPNKNFASHSIMESILRNPNQLLAESTCRQTRVLAKKENQYYSIKLQEVVCFYSDHKHSFLVRQDGGEYSIDKTLKDLENELNPKDFYRVNRQYIINIRYLKSFKPYENKKLKIELKWPVKLEIIIGEEMRINFKRWINSL